MPLFRAPYYDANGRLQFDGYGWFAALAMPWAVGVYTIVSWLA